MKTYFGLWVTTLVIALGLGGQAVLDDSISFGGGLDDPIVRLTKGEVEPIDVDEGGTLNTSCYLEGAQEEDFIFTWVRVGRDGNRVRISEGKDLELTNVNMGQLNELIFCEALRIYDDDVFDKQLRIRIRQQQPTRTLQISPMPSEDKARGFIVQKCEIIPPPPSNEPWTITWFDPNGRVAKDRDILTVQVTAESGAGKYTCEARNSRTNDILQGTFTIHANLIPGQGSQSYHTKIETITPSLEFGMPYEARCFVSPQPREPVDYVWYLREREVARGERIRVNQIDRMSTGKYICRPMSRGYSADRPDYANATLGLYLKASADDHTELRPPPGSTLITHIGEVRELHCELSQGAQNLARWYFNGSEINFNSRVNLTGNVNRVDFKRVSILILTGVTEYQEGQYECRTDDAIKRVNVIVLTDYDVEVNPPLYVLDEGEDAEIHCSVQGGKEVANYELQWFFRPVGSSERIPLSFNTPGSFIRTDDPRAQRTSVIFKRNVRMQEEGEYICVEPRGQEDSSTVQIRKVSKPTLYITPGIIRVRPGQIINVDCYALMDDGKRRRQMPDLRVFDNRVRLEKSPGDRDGTVHGTITRVDSSLNNLIIECFDAAGGIEPVKAIIYVEDVCPPGYRRCRNGQCLEAGRFCDGVRDCDDNSDEDPSVCDECDPISIRCQPHRGQQPRKPTFMVHWQCDGEDDCGNGFDESFCSDPSIVSCIGRNFTCGRSNLQIPRSFVCDKDPDCESGSDEDGCIEPQILDEPPSQVNHRRGDRVELRCRVAGYPSPRVIWRFNWGCLPEQGGRMSVVNRVEGCGTSSQSVISTLTINNFTPGDDGIYNCEGIHGQKRAMSRDYLVVLRD